MPIHDSLLQAGFLDFLADIKASGHPRLFPNLSAGTCRKTGEPNGRYSQGFVNQFAAYLKGLGFGKGIGSHAFRHTLATELDAKGVRVEHIALITGHALNKKAPVLQDNYVHKIGWEHPEDPSGGVGPISAGCDAAELRAWAVQGAVEEGGEGCSARY